MVTDASARLAALEREMTELRGQLAGGPEGSQDPRMSRRGLMFGGLGLLGAAGAVVGLPSPAGADPPQPDSTFQRAFFWFHPWIDVMADFNQGAGTPRAGGQGATDDTPAFELALNLAALGSGGSGGIGATIYVPAGQYLVT